MGLSEGHLLYTCLIAGLAGLVYGWVKTSDRPTYRVPPDWPAVGRLIFAAGAFSIGASQAPYGPWWVYGLVGIGAAKLGDLLARCAIEAYRFVR